VFQNVVQKRIFGPKREELTGCLRKLCNEELHDLYTPPYTTGIRVTNWRRMSLSVPAAGMIKSALAFTVMSGTHEAKRPPGRSRHGLKYNMEVAYK
jgi:hypothetical protein